MSLDGLNSAHTVGSGSDTALWEAAIRSGAAFWAPSKRGGLWLGGVEGQAGEGWFPWSCRQLPRAFGQGLASADPARGRAGKEAGASQRLELSSELGQVLEV